MSTWRRWRMLPWVAPLFAAALLLPAPLSAQEPPVRITVSATAEATLVDGATKVTPGAEVGVDGPLVLGHATPARLFARIQVLALPGSTAAPDLTVLEQYRAIRATAGVLRDVGQLTAGGQDVRTSVVGHASFSTRLGADPAPLDRYARAYGVGVQVAELKAGSYLRIEYGRDESVGPFHRGQLLLAGAVPISGTHGIASLQAEAALQVGHPLEPSHDRIVIRVALSPPHEPSAAPSPPTPAATPPAAVAAPSPKAPTPESELGTTPLLLSVGRSGTWSQDVGAQDEGSWSAPQTTAAPGISEEHSVRGARLPSAGAPFEVDHE